MTIRALPSCRRPASVRKHVPPSEVLTAAFTNRYGGSNHIEFRCGSLILPAELTGVIAAVLTLNECRRQSRMSAPATAATLETYAKERASHSRVERAQR